MFRFIAAVAGGLAMWAANPPIGWWILAFAAIALLWIAVRDGGVFAGFLHGWVWGATFFLPLFYWATVASGTLLAHVALAAVEALYIGVLGAIWAVVSRIGHLKNVPLGGRVVVQIFLGVFTWLAMEQLRSSWPFGGMPWGTLGFSLVDSPLIRLAPYGSTALVGGVAVVAALLAAMAPRMRFLGAMASVIVILCLVFLPVFVPIGASPSATVNIGVVQGNIPAHDAENRALQVTKNHVEATRTMLAASHVTPDLILWPESSSDRDVREDPQAGEMVFDLVQETRIPLVMGTQKYVEAGRYNDVLVIQPHAGVVDRYSKQHPVPFGEYVPYRDFFRQFSAEIDRIGVDMLAGDGPANVSVTIGEETLNLAVPICFEVAYTSIVAESVKVGAQFVVVPTNNASFGDTALSEQQFAMSRFRAIEHGRTVIQVSSSGISGVVNSHGKVLYETELFTQDARVVKVGLHDSLTIASRSAGGREFSIYILGAVSAMVAGVTAFLTRDRGGS
ncbi:apolipoprotein N-acyltransferase [Trueperella bonasi]|uniref:Apolipoprotein N-acyltransferase n=1 Tax=Trueperella bonasi TaxID=312286 RepID=A0ABT9NDJ7_9ACTO|nr:apolipoprotein N-acyltransferase [Trueperella bonasi]MDP9805464.1 apolipoprotein N-acyltransferase [Trueperella bonasi]